MNTVSQKVVERSHVRAPDSGFAEPAGTSKIFVRRFDGIGMPQWSAMVEWCYENLYHGGHYEPNWHHQWPTFYFRDEREYTLFLLRWA